MKYNHLDVIRVLEKCKNKQKAAGAMRFFKTGKGQYGEGDQFFGITVPEQRKIAKEFFNLSLSDIDKLIRHPVHECRLTALLIAVAQYQKGDETQREKIYRWYLKNAKRMNNWDLVDASASAVVGAHLSVQPVSECTRVLVRCATSDNLWERRIAIVATHYCIRQGSFEPTLTIATQLLSDKHDLIHKATGWMLREMGKKDENVLRTFLNMYAKQMPRTMLRYAIEKMSREEKKVYMRKGVF